MSIKEKFHDRVSSQTRDNPQAKQMLSLSFPILSSFPFSTSNAVDPDSMLKIVIVNLKQQQNPL